MSRGWCFEIMNADDKKILQVKVDHLVGAFDEVSGEDTEDDDNPIRGFLKRNHVVNDEENDRENIDDKEAAIARNKQISRDVERMVNSGNEKRILVETELNECEVKGSDINS